MDKIACLIVDDEPLALDLVESYVLRTPFLSLKGKCTSAVEAIKMIDTHKVSLIFLDIQMPDLTGLELSRILPKYIKVIFTTAFSDYALDGYKVSALDYLLKPFDYEEFLQAATKAQEWFASTQNIATPPADFIFVHADYQQVKIMMEDITYIEGLRDYVKIFTARSSRPVLTRLNLKAMEEKLDPDKFVRVHRSFIISVNKVDAVTKSKVRIGEVDIPMSDLYEHALQKILGY